MNAGSINDKIQADTQLTQALQGLRVSVEAYPDLKANTNFLQLQEKYRILKISWPLPAAILMALPES